MNSRLRHIRSIVKEMQAHIGSIQKFFPKEYIKSLTYNGLLANCHPLYREGYRRKLKNAGITDI